MNLTHNGKIGRLPEVIREEVNVRLRQGEKGRALVTWLNELPEVRAMLLAEFDGKPVREQNLSEWRKGGYLYWLRMQEAYTMMKQIGPEAVALNEAAKEPVTATLATWVTAQYVVAVKSAEGLGGDQTSGWDRMREFCHDVLALRRVEVQGERLELDREKLDFGREKVRAEMTMCLLKGRMFGPGGRPPGEGQAADGEHSTPNIQHSTPNDQQSEERQEAGVRAPNESEEGEAPSIQHPSAWMLVLGAFLFIRHSSFVIPGEFQHCRAPPPLAKSPWPKHDSTSRNRSRTARVPPPRHLFT